LVGRRLSANATRDAFEELALQATVNTWAATSFQ